MSLRYFEFSFIFILIISLFFGNLFISKALAISPSSISVRVAPENPSPYQDVTINLSSYAANLDSVLISWIVNNKTILSGIGKKSFSLKAGASGTEEIVLIQINFPDGLIELRVPIRPGNLVLLYQAVDSHVPPFYKGKALTTQDGSVKIVAMPEIKNSSGSLANPKNMTYSWKFNYSNDQEASGYGKDSFIYDNDYLENANTVNVSVSTLDQKYGAEANITVATTDPKIVFYKRDEQMGTLFENVLKDNHKIDSEEMVEAIPYFLSPKILSHPSLIWTWSINNSQVFPTSIVKNLIPLKVGEGVSGVANLRLDIENEDSISQIITKEINIQF